ncbi:hypothetical protein [Streptomyces sp. NPDC050287]|uniref:hypothetical protein n=1 Tax=Streptomyces sp. NPDC050287 TaxID=3365608 RepID=UPI0037B5C98B
MARWESLETLADPPPIREQPKAELWKECFSSDGGDSDFGGVRNRFTAAVSLDR